MGINNRVIKCNVMSGTNATDSAVEVWPYAQRGKLVKAYVVPLAGVTASDTDYITITAPINSTTIFTRVTNVAGGAFTANTPEAQTLNTSLTGTKLEVGQGDAITFAVAKAGTGPAYELNVSLEFELVPGA